MGKSAFRRPLLGVHAAGGRQYGQRCRWARHRFLRSLSGGGEPHAGRRTGHADITPTRGSSVSADPISLLRGAEHKELAIRFMEYLLQPEGQRLWNYAPGTPGGPDQFVYHFRWTARHFSIHRDLIRAMCLDAGDELRAAWKAIVDHGGPDRNPEAITLLRRMPDRPEPLTWVSALGIAGKMDRIEYMREWTIFFRDSYKEARALAQSGGEI